MSRAVVFLLISLAMPIAARSATLHGTVTSPSGPVAGARVVAEVSERGKLVASSSQITGSDGAFSFAVNAGAFIEVVLSATPPEGLTLARDSVRFPMSRDTEVRLKLAPFVRISGQVNGAQGEVSVELYSLNPHVAVTSAASPAFTFRVPAGVYAVLVRGSQGPPYLGRRNVDARRGDVSDVVITIGGAPEPIVFDDGPDATKITIGPADENGIAQIVGASASVPPLSAVLVTNFDALSTQVTMSDPDGSFRLQLFAPPGSSLQIRCERTGLFYFGAGTEIDIPPATIIHVPSPVGRATLVSFIDEEAVSASITPHDVERLGTRDPGRWTFETAWPAATWSAGTRASIAGKLTIYSKNLAKVADLKSISVVAPWAALTVLFDRSGTQRSPGTATFMSSIMTPTGLPIERGSVFMTIPSGITCGTFERRSPERAETECRLSIDLPSSMAPAIYRPFFSFVIRGIPSEEVHFGAAPSLPGATGVRQSHFPPVTVGPVAPPRLYSMLLLHEFSNGSRGALAMEDRGKFSFASHVVTNTPHLIIPRRDPRTGVPRTYRLEPFVPMISSTAHRFAEVPQITFKFPSGSLRVRVKRPDGIVDDLGPAPFVQSTSRGDATRSGVSISNVTKHVVDLYQLTTNDARFRYTFPADGTYVIEMSGTISDLSGNVYTCGGTYEIEVARTLDVDTAVVAGTPFEVGDRFIPDIKIDPAVAADVEVKLTVIPDSDQAKRFVRTWRGRANRFGHFQGDPFRFISQGEYRVDVFATWTDAGGERWAGAMTAGSVIATPSSPIITHGRRGFDSQQTIGRQWFFVRDDRAGPDHVMLPFHSGDVIWLEDTPPGGSAETTMISLQDPVGDLAARVRSKAATGIRPWLPPSSLDERIAAGEIPLFSSIADGSSPSLEPDRTDQWGYFYAFIERPGVHVRELVTEDITSGNGYWRFGENYQFQLGAGINGDLPNDFKFQFGGAVWRDLKDGFRYYGAYASLFVLLPPSGRDEGRIFPPFQGNGGGPDGGPLFKLKGQNIDLFFHPTAVRPGTILERAEVAPFAGYSAPTLPSKIEITVTSPSGLTRTIRGQASKVGYFYDPGFRVEEEGVWKAKGKITFDGVTSAGQLTAPFPTGDVLGSREGEFYFYVVRGDAPPLEVRGAPMSSSAHVRPADGPITFTVTAPPGLTSTQLTYTTTMPGFILEEGTTPGLTYTYDAQKLARDFPNLDLHDADGFAGADTITISFLLSGTDTSGARKHFARQIVIQGEELQMPEQRPNVTMRRRATR